MRRWMRLLAGLGMVLSVLTGVVPAVSMGAAAGESAVTESLVGRVATRVVVDELPAGVAVTAGLVKSTLAPASVMTLQAGSAPMVVLVEDGTLVVDSTRGDGPARVLPRGTPVGVVASPVEVASPSADAMVGGTIVEGDAAVLPAGSTTMIRNERNRPAQVLTLLSAFDAVTTAEGEVVSGVLAAGRYVTTSDPIEIKVEHRNLDTGERVDRAEPPTETIAAAVVRSQGPKLGTSATGYVNRDSEPMPVYVVTIAGLALEGGNEPAG